MRASRLLHLLLLLQNRGRQTSTKLGHELEVTPRTILRDVDALTEAGFPVIVHQGAKGGIELGFNYRSRLTGFAKDEAEAIAVLFGRSSSELAELGLEAAAKRAFIKWAESCPEVVRATIRRSQSQVRFENKPLPTPDPRIAAMAHAIRSRYLVIINARSRSPRSIHPIGLVKRDDQWAAIDRLQPEPAISTTDWGDMRVSKTTF